MTTFIRLFVAGSAWGAIFGFTTMAAIAYWLTPGLKFTSADGASGWAQGSVAVIAVFAAITLAGWQARQGERQAEADRLRQARIIAILLYPGFIEGARRAGARRAELDRNIKLYQGGGLSDEWLNAIVAKGHIHLPTEVAVLMGDLHVLGKRPGDAIATAIAACGIFNRELELQHAQGLTPLLDWIVGPAANAEIMLRRAAAEIMEFLGEGPWPMPGVSGPAQVVQLPVADPE